MIVEIQQVEERLREYFGKGLSQVACSICRGTRLEVEDYLAKTPAFDPSTDQETGKLILEIVVSCRNCSHALRFDAEALGAL